MDVSLEKASLLKIIQSAQKALSNKSTLPVLNGIHLQSSNNQITAYSTDLEIAVKDKTECLIKKEGTVVIFGNLLVDLIKNLDDGKIDLTLDEKENKLTIKSSKSKFNLNTLPIEDFPPFPEVEEGHTVQIENSDLIDSIRQVAISSSRDDSRPVLSGILFEINNQNTLVVATDSYRLAVKEIKSEHNQESTSLIIPRRAAEEIIKILPKEGKTKMSFSQNQISFENNNIKFVSRLIGGQYPNYQQLFPSEFKVEATVNREKLLQSAKRMALLSPTTPILIKVGDSTITTSSKSADVGNGQEIIEVKGKTKELEVAFNSKYLIDGLSVLGDEEIILQLVDSFQPGLIKGTINTQYKYLIMPVRLN